MNLHASPRRTGDPLAELIARIAARDEEALRELYERTAPRVFGMALLVLGDRALAEEALVDVFEQVWRSAERFDAARGSAASWIALLARTRAIDQQRRRRRTQGREHELGDEEAWSLGDGQPAPDLGSADAERAQIVRAAVEALPREQRIALQAAFFGGLSHSEVAAELQQPLGTVKARIRSALAALRVKLARLEGDLA